MKKATLPGNRGRRSPARPSQRPDIGHPALAGRLDLGLLLAIASRAFGDALHSRLQAAGFRGLRPAHTYTLQALHEGRMTPGQLAQFLRVTKPGAGKVIDELEALGYVDRHADPNDGRSSLTGLTERGQAAWHTGVAVGEELEAWLAADLDKQKAAGARACLLAIARRYARGQRAQG